MWPVTIVTHPSLDPYTYETTSHGNSPRVDEVSETGNKSEGDIIEVRPEEGKPIFNEIQDADTFLKRAVYRQISNDDFEGAITTALGIMNKQERQKSLRDVARTCCEKNKLDIAEKAVDHMPIESFKKSEDYALIVDKYLLSKNIEAAILTALKTFPFQKTEILYSKIYLCNPKMNLENLKLIEKNLTYAPWKWNLRSVILKILLNENDIQGAIDIANKGVEDQEELFSKIFEKIVNSDNPDLELANSLIDELDIDDQPEAIAKLNEKCQLKKKLEEKELIKV